MRSTLPAFNEIWQREFRHQLLIQAEQFSAEKTFLIGCSGGMDSMLLLRLMSNIFPARIRALYIDHQLQTVSADWGVVVQQYAKELGVPALVQSVDVGNGNLENQARNARYQAFSQHLLPNEVLVLAHHQQDQAETVLLRLLSGAGVTGLAAMQVVEQRKQWQLWRPFLNLSREAIERWVSALHIPFVQDTTNTDTKYDRAWCRQQLWPVLKQRYPKMQEAISRSSLLMQDANQILQDIVQQDFKDCGNAQQLDLHKLQQLSQPRQRQLLSVWMKGLAEYRPALTMVERLQHEVILAKADAQAALHWNGYYYLRYQQQLFRIEKALYLAQKSVLMPLSLYLTLNQELNVESGRFLIGKAKVGLSLHVLNQELMLVPRYGGEKIHLHGRVGHWPLKKALQEAQILPWLRHTIQILMLDDVMLGVFTPKGFWLAQSKYCEVGGWLPLPHSEQDILRVERNS